ncbi:MAG: Ribonuclease HII [Parcubacteria group bacterium GW2011_GWF2_38_76]|nr:MAG: Ribonuclease HII [Parcubacteria group bacterium GW2011_GWF2_38_76]HBM45914.1 ribonuclease HII [Patescibacteria group bacterium]
MKYRWYLGIDEVGRGPLAGPITICVAAFKTRKPKFLRGIRDSKKLTAQKREDWLNKIKIAKEEGNVLFCVSSTDNEQIDKVGITKATNLAIEKSLKKLKLEPCQCLVLLDGGLKAPIEYIYQETIIRGDDKERIISASSVIAKVNRDNIMIDYSKKYPQYNFHEHKGYGTRAHYEALKKYGKCQIHRISFLKKFYGTINSNNLIK